MANVQVGEVYVAKNGSEYTISRITPKTVYYIFVKAGKQSRTEYHDGIAFVDNKISTGAWTLKGTSTAPTAITKDSIKAKAAALNKKPDALIADTLLTGSDITKDVLRTLKTRDRVCWRGTTTDYIDVIGDVLADSYSIEYYTGNDWADALANQTPQRGILYIEYLESLLQKGNIINITIVANASADSAFKAKAAIDLSIKVGDVFQTSQTNFLWMVEAIDGDKIDVKVHDEKGLYLSNSKEIRDDIEKYLTSGQIIRLPDSGAKAAAQSVNADKKGEVGAANVITDITEKDILELAAGDTIFYKNFKQQAQILERDGNNLKVVVKNDLLKYAINLEVDLELLIRDDIQKIVKAKTLKTAPVTATTQAAPKAPPSTNAEWEMENLKKSISQLVFMRNLLLPIDFEKKIEINQEIRKVQQEIDKLSFSIMEKRLNSPTALDDIFEQSFEDIKHSYNNTHGNVNETEFFTPDGKASILSDELNEIVRTKAFKDWFGDWEMDYLYKDSGVRVGCSEVMTADFEPLIVWHGTGKEFSFFKFDSFPAAYFSVNKAYAEWFGQVQGGDNGYVIPFFLNIRNGLDLTPFGTEKVRAKDFFDYLYLKTGKKADFFDINPVFLDKAMPPQQAWVYLRNNPKMLKKIAEGNIFDGIHYYEDNPSVPIGDKDFKTEAYIIFSANQCKIAHADRGMLLIASLKSFLLKNGGIV